MTAVPEAGPTHGTRSRAPWLTLGRGSLIALALLVIALVATTTYRSDSTAAPGAAAKFDPAEYGADTYTSKVVPAIRKNAVAITTIEKALATDSDAAGKRYGHRDGTGPYSFAVTLTGTAGSADGGLLQITVPGMAKTRVSVQVGPAVNGTALRDAVGFITFGQFVNQVDYADAGTALNNQVKADVLTGLNVASLKGRKVTVVGAMSPLTPDVLTVTPISIEPAP
jgi:predicted lipoprotein